jgi:hypothetical protein
LNRAMANSPEFIRVSGETLHADKEVDARGQKSATD